MFEVGMEPAPVTTTVGSIRMPRVAVVTGLAFSILFATSGRDRRFGTVFGRRHGPAAEVHFS
jgi:hypothetical protein